MPELHHCRSCFNDTLSLPWMSGNMPETTCDFCGSQDVPTWSVVAAAEFIGPLAQAYERNPDGTPLHQALQDEWAPFGDLTGDTRVKLIRAILASSELETPDALELVTVRRRPGRDSAALTEAWSSFSQDLRIRNRWFPPNLEDGLDILDGVVQAHRWIASQGQVLHRARVCLSGDKFEASDMKKPPPHLASGGRGNPMGIAHFYGASTRDTAVKECRPVHNCTVTVARFSLMREFDLLDLTPTTAIDPFQLALASDEGATWERYAEAITSRLVREHIGAELARPVRPNEGEADYASTQFVCEFAKMRGVDGVRYQSAVDPGEWNVVLFDDDALTCLDIQRFEVVSLDLSIETVSET